MTRQHTGIFAWLLALLVAAVFCGFGLWQLQRMHQKEALLAQLPPSGALAVTLDEAMRAPHSLHWLRDRLQFLPGTVLLDNQLRGGRAGVKVYQAARAQNGMAVLVDLGWLPLPADRELPAVAPQQGWRALEGLWAPAPSSGLALGPPMSAAPQAQIWLATRVELPAIAHELGLAPAALAPRVLRLDPALPLGYTRDLELLPNTLPPSRHLGYAVQWFGMALAVLMIACVLQWRRRKRGGR
ncbi:MAG: SURF1 family protein [Stenotrophomonas sp.]|uniref:SURF1 family protein n=1 Tax=Stenotrophomonas sp. TaxID=69392 RepID=UPI003D6C7C7B